MKRALLIALSAAAILRADFSYRETTRINNEKKAGSSTKIVKGNRMAAIEKSSIAVIDLDKETITQIDLARKTYYVLTFAQMKQATAGPAPTVKVERAALVQATGKTKNIGVLPVKQTILTLTVEGQVAITIDSWMATIPGYDEVRSFQRKLTEKLGYGFGSGIVLGQYRTEIGEQMSKIDGAPLESTTRAVSPPNGETLAEAFTELSNFSSAPLDGSRFDVPPGFKQIQPDARLTGGAR
ncbi:MAG TPA: hypothetical protein VH639_00435 [Bryobacteraceae bacterium]|jgi:hypothetical protein